MNDHPHCQLCDACIDTGKPHVRVTFVRRKETTVSLCYACSVPVALICTSEGVTLIELPDPPAHTLN